MKRSLPPETLRLPLAGLGLIAGFLLGEFYPVPPAAPVSVTLEEAPPESVLESPPPPVEDTPEPKRAEEDADLLTIGNLRPEDLPERLDRLRLAGVSQWMTRTWLVGFWKAQAAKEPLTAEQFQALTDPLNEDAQEIAAAFLHAAAMTGAEAETMLTNTPSALRDDLLSRLAEGLCAEAPERVLKFAESATPVLRARLQTGAYAAWAETGETAARQAVESLPEGAEKNRLLAAFWWGRMRADPAGTARLMALEKIPVRPGPGLDSAWRAYETEEAVDLEFAMNRLAQRDGAETALRMLLKAVPEQRQWWSAGIAALAAENYQSAAKLTEQLAREKIGNIDALGGAVRSVSLEAGRRGDAAWLAKLPGFDTLGYSGVEAERNYARGMMDAREPAEVMREILSNAGARGSRQDVFAFNALQVWAETRRHIPLQEALAGLPADTPAHLQESAALALIQEAGYFQPLEAAETLERVKSPAQRKQAMETLMGEWMTGDPFTALAWAEANAERFPEALSEALKAWPDALSGSERINALPPGPARDSAAAGLAGLAVNILGVDSGAAVMWAASVGDAAKRQEAFQQMAEHAALKDMAFESVNLPENFAPENRAALQQAWTNAADRHAARRNRAGNP